MNINAFLGLGFKNTENLILLAAAANIIEAKFACQGTQLGGGFEFEVS